MVEYIVPKYELEVFNCPHCNTYAHQREYNNFIFEKITITVMLEDSERPYLNVRTGI